MAEATVVETEEALVTRAQEALSACRWVVGECAARWTQRYARGRTDADFGQLIGLSADQVYQRRRVWETFADVRDRYPELRWSHFYAALNWDDAPECLTWANDLQSTVAEMKAWRRAQRGEDLSQPADEAFEHPVAYLPEHASPVLAPDDSPPFEGGTRRGSTAADEAERLAGVSRQTDPLEDSYAPFRTGAASPPPRADHESDPVERPAAVSPDQLLKRMTSTLERCTRALSDEFVSGFEDLPESLRERFFAAVEAFSDRVNELR